MLIKKLSLDEVSVKTKNTLSLDCAPVEECPLNYIIAKNKKLSLDYITIKMSLDYIAAEILPAAYQVPTSYEKNQ